jgi:hypothetical protein
MRYVLVLLFILPVFLWAQSTVNPANHHKHVPSVSLQESAVPKDIASPPQISVLSTNSEQVGLYEKFEAVFQLQNATFQNPYNPSEIDVRATFISPNGKTWKIFGFYDNYQNRNQWKVRFSPNETGTWKYTLQATASNGSGTSTEYTFKAAASRRHGWLKVSPINPHYLMQDDGTPFYGLGPAYPWQVNDGPNGLALLEASGANMFYYWNIMYDTGGGIIESMNSGLGRYDQPKCGRIDQVIEWAENRGMNVMLSIWPHDLLCKTLTGWVQQWNQNPYNQICDVREFFASETAWTYEEKQYRYIIARWGHSRGLGIWELVCEINGTDGWTFGDHDDVLNWVESTTDFLKQNDPYGRPVTVSQSGGIYWPEGYAIVDLPNVHLYETGWSARYTNDPLRSSLWIYGNISQKFWLDFDKPGIMGEAGYMDNYGNYSPSSENYVALYHNALWVTWANGLAATPLWWDFTTKSIFTPAFLAQMLAFSKVVHGIDYAHIPLNPATVSVPGCDAYAMEGDTLAFGWIRDIMATNVSTKAFILEGLNDASYSIQWLNPWTGDPVQSKVLLSRFGRLQDQIPQLSENLKDIAFIARPSGSAGSPQQLELAADPVFLYGDTSNTSQISCFILDAQGRLCTSAGNSVLFTLTGPGTLEGTNPAAPADGAAGITLRADANSGTARIVATSSGLASDTLDILIKKFFSIDDFEAYSSDAGLKDAWPKRYGTTTDVFLETSLVGEGGKAMRLEYSVGNGSPSYAGVSRTLSGEWSKAKSLSFWLKPDGSGRTLNIRFYKNNANYWYVDYPLTESDSATVTIPLDRFRPNFTASSFDPALMTQIAVTVNQDPGSPGSGILYLDDLKFLSTEAAPVETPEDGRKPADYRLCPNYPNPFNHETAFEYQIPREERVTVTIHNMLGERIETLVKTRQSPGRYTAHWNAEKLASGIYFYQIEAGGFTERRKCVLLK